MGNEDKRLIQQDRIEKHGQKQPPHAKLPTMGRPKEQQVPAPQPKEQKK